MRLISPSSRKLWAGLQKAARYGSPVRNTAIIGSICVVGQLPNFNRFLKEHNVDFEPHTARN
jgi:hypothetical protein